MGGGGGPQEGAQVRVQLRALEREAVHTEDPGLGLEPRRPREDPGRGLPLVWGKLVLGMSPGRPPGGWGDRKIWNSWLLPFPWSPHTTCPPHFMLPNIRDWGGPGATAWALGCGGPARQASSKATRTRRGDGSF